MLNAYKFGWKTSYYQNTYDFKSEEEDVQPAGYGDTVDTDDGEEVELELSDRQITNGHAKVNANVEVKVSAKEDDCDACTI